MKKVKSVLTNMAYQMATARFHLIHKNEVKKILRNIEEVKGKSDSKLIKLSDEYANDVFGWQGYAPWLYVYSAITGSFKEGWIPDNYFGRVVVPSLQGYYGKVSNLKPFVSKVFDYTVFPDLAYYVNGLYFSKNTEVLNEKDISNILFKDFEQVVYKLDNSLQGGAVFFFEKSSFDIRKIHNLGNGVFQQYIQQHPFFEELIPASVATLRITTVVDDRGMISVRAAYLRLGRNADTHVKSTSHIRIPVDTKSGELNKYGYLNTWLTVDRHPDTHVLFEKRKIPSYKKCVSTALELHRSIPFVRCVGWDMIIDNNATVKIMEWNGYHNDIKFSEAIQGPCFSDLGWEELWKENLNKKIKMELNFQFEGKHR